MNYFVEAVKKLHDDRDNDPQYAKIRGGKVSYAFGLKGFTFVKDKIEPTFVYSQEQRKKNSFVRQFIEAEAKVLDLLLSEYKINVNIDRKNDNGRYPLIVLSYTPSTSEEMEYLRRFFESIPEDGGTMPKRGQDFFGYD